MCWLLKVDSRPVRGVAVCFQHRSAHHVSAAASLLRTERRRHIEDKLSAHIKGGGRERGGGGFMDLRRVYLIFDFKETPAESQSRAAPAEPSAIRLIDNQTR